MKKDESITHHAVPSTTTVGDDDGVEMKPMSIVTTVNNPKNMVSFKTLSLFTFQNHSDAGVRGTSNDVQILWEVCAYGTIFMFTGLIAAIHRQVL